MISYNDVIPMEYQNELLNMRDMESRNSFRAGDITNELLAQNQDKDLVYSAVGSYVGKAKRTVREYAMVSRFYPDKIRQKYEILSYEHFRVAMRYGDRWEEALEWSVDQTEIYNKPATVDAMETVFKAEETAENYQPYIEEEYIGALGKLSLVLRDILQEIKDDEITRAVENLIKILEEKMQVV